MVVSVVSVVETSDRYAPSYKLLQLEEFEATNSESGGEACGPKLKTTESVRLGRPTLR